MNKDEKNNGLTISIKLPYKTQKMMKKLHGKYLGREIAIGRKLVKLLKSKYNNLIEENNVRSF